MKDCPSDDQLERYSKGQLTAFDFKAVSSHIEVCETCKQTMEPIMEGQTLEIDSEAQTKAQPIRSDGLPPDLANHPRYRILGLLSVGGMGAVYKGEHLFLERPVVIKVIRRELLDNPQHVRRFKREAMLSAQLSHPNIVTVYEAENTGSTQFLVMEFLQGKDLGMVTKERAPIAVEAACGWVQQAALGLQYIHERGMVHRDIKPSNLFLTDEGRVKILDLGLAYLRTRASTSSGTELTLRGQVFGTVGFCSPEQLEQSSTVDIRADIYSLGCTLYYLLTGEAPFANSGSLIDQILAHRQLPVPSVRDIRPDVPEEMVPVLNRMLAKRAEDRYSTPAEVAEALAPFAPAIPYSSSAGGRPISAASSELPYTGRGGGRLFRGAGLAGLVAGVLLAAVLLYWFFARSGAPRAAVVLGEPPIKVGILHSRSGTMSISERPVIDATLFAIDEINASGGVLGRRVEAVLEDGESDPQAFAAKAEKLITQDRVSALFGCWTSASRKAVKPVVEKYNHLLMYPVQNEGLEQSPNIIYLGAAPNQQIIPAVKWCVSFLNKKRLFLVGSDYIFPRAANAIIRDEVKALGAEIVGEEYVPLGTTNVTSVVGKIRASRADIILNTINGDTNISFYRELRAAGVSSSVVPVISFSLSERELGSLSLQDVLGDYVAANYFQSIDTPDNHAFVNRFRGSGLTRTLSDPMEAAYVGMRLWAQAVEAAHSESLEEVRPRMAGQSYNAPEGLVRIDPATGRTNKFIRIGRMAESGQFEVVYASDIAIEPVPYPLTRSRAQWEAFLTDLQLSWGGAWANPRRQAR